MPGLERGSNESKNHVFSNKPADSNQHILIHRPSMGKNAESRALLVLKAFEHSALPSKHMTSPCLR